MTWCKNCETPVILHPDPHDDGPEGGFLEDADEYGVNGRGTEHVCSPEESKRP